MTVVGFIDSGHPGYAGRVKAGRQLALHPQAEPVPVLGRVDRLAEWVHRVGATDVVVALTGRPATRVRPQVAHLDATAVRVHWVSRRPSRSTMPPAPAPPRPSTPLGLAARPDAPSGPSTSSARRSACSLLSPLFARGRG